MRLRPLVTIIAAIASLNPLIAYHGITTGCGTTRETPAETLFLHRQAQRARTSRPRALTTALPSANRDIGNIAIIEDSDGVVERQNQFNLDNNTVTFTPSAGATHYGYAVASQGYDAAAAAGTPLAALDDDDSRQITLPFAFPFFGASYTQVFVNSDGNLTFVAADHASTERSLGRMTAGPPRISPLFDDLDPSKTAGGVRVTADATRVAISWVAVPEYAQVGTGVPETFQVRLYPDGRIQFSYAGINPSVASAVVGIAPGGLRGSTSIVDFRSDPTGDYTGAVAERFGSALAIDIVTVAQKFYQTHEDSYDYLVIYNNMGIQAMGDAIAYENTIRAAGTGYNVPVQDAGAQYGSGSRLQAILNMGQLTQYPVDPNGIVPARFTAGDTPLTVLSHEAGHLFLAFASIKDPNDATSFPMLGYQLAHWNFAYDSEASFLEGERIVDQGAAVTPRFMTTDTVKNYSPLDQYLMGFRPASAVADTFAVTNASLNGFVFNTSQIHPISGVSFDGTRLNVTIGDLIQQVGRRTPDYTVAQRRFRFGFIMVVAQGTTPTAADLAQVDTYRQQFEPFYGTASSGNGIADTSVRRSLKLSIFPAAGVVANGTGTGSVTLQSAPASDLTVQFQTPGGHAQFPASVRIAAGSTSATFSFSGVKAGVEEVLATPSDPAWETAAARVQVADATLLKLVAVSGDQQIPTTGGALPSPIVARLTDINNLPYPGTKIDAAASAGGSVAAGSAVTDGDGRVSFAWTPGPGPSNQLTLTVDGTPSVSLTVRAGSAVPVAAAVVNAASYESGVAAGAVETVFGANLAGGQTLQSNYPWPLSLGNVAVTLNGTAMPVLYVSDGQVNFYVPANIPLGAATLTVTPPSGAAAMSAVKVTALQPGIFAGAVLKAGTAVSAVTSAVKAGDYLEIYCTGLGATQSSGGFQKTVLTPTVFVGPVPVQPTYSGLAPGWLGLYQVNVQMPAGLAAGTQPLILEINLQHSNIVNITVQ